MRRRELITLLGSVAVTWPLSARAQPASLAKKPPRIGFLAFSPPSPVDQSLFDAFARGLREHGYVEGQNLAIEYRFWKGDREQLAKYAAELVSLGVDVIFAPSTYDALAAKRATEAIPIVTATALDVVVNGLAASLARPGGNVTGMSAGTDPQPKMLEILAEAVPTASRFAALMNPDIPFQVRFFEAFERAAVQMHVTIVPAVKRVADDIAPAFAKMAADGIEAVIVFGDPVEYANRRAIIAAAAKHRVPAGYFWKIEAEEGGLLAYSFDIDDLQRRAAGYVAKILQGAKPADLPIEQPDRFTMVINLRTAKELGVTIPTSLLLRADKVIE